MSIYCVKIIDSLYKKLYNIVVKDGDSIKAFQKRELVKKEYNLIANMYSEEFCKKCEDIEIVEEFISKLNPNSKILDLGAIQETILNTYVYKELQINISSI